MPSNEFDHWVQTFPTGSASTLETSVKYPRKKKHPIGFAPAMPKKPKRTNRNRREGV